MLATFVVPSGYACVISDVWYCGRVISLSLSLLRSLSNLRAHVVTGD